MTTRRDTKRATKSAPLARAGLADAGVSPGDIDRYLGIIHDRVEAGTTGSRWMIRSLQGGAPNAELIVFSNVSDEEIEKAGGLPESAVVLPHPVDLNRLEVVLREKINATRAG